MANVKTKQSVSDRFHLPAETDGKFKVQCKHCCSEISDSKKINSNFLTHLTVRHTFLLCQLTCQSADIISSLCGVGIRVRVNNFFSKTTRPRDMLLFLKDTLSIEDEKLFKACKSVCSSVC